MADSESFPEPQLYYFPDEGITASVVIDGQQRLYTRQGLEYLVLRGRQQNTDTRAAERALAMINQTSFSPKSFSNIYQFEFPFRDNLQGDNSFNRNSFRIGVVGKKQ